ncbi:MAG: OmpA family protein [Fibrobacter sp.]|nr:OmpA family protein [Fibrobacter sp.]
MDKKTLLASLALATSFGFAAEAASAPAEAPKDPIASCKEKLDNAKANLPSNALAAKTTLSEAYGTLKKMEVIQADDPKSEILKELSINCEMYNKIVMVQAETQTLHNHIAENWEKRIATGRSIEAIQEQIASVRSGKMSDLAADLEAEKARLAQTSEAMKEQEARLQAELQQNQEKFQAEAAAQQAALKAAGEREAELQKKLAEEQAALAEERAKAEARQQEAMNKLNELQSKLIQVSKDARGIILSMSDILFDVNKATLKADLKTSLAKVAGILSVYQQFNVSIEGNTDNTGSEDHNMKLSQQRADNVMNFLVEQGIDAGRLTAKGLGMSMPIADNSTKEGRQKNRRVDLVIQDKALQQQAEQ